MLAQTFNAGKVLTYAGIAFISVMGGFLLVGLAVKPMKKKPPAPAVTVAALLVGALLAVVLFRSCAT